MGQLRIRLSRECNREQCKLLVPHSQQQERIKLRMATEKQKNPLSFLQDLEMY